MDATAELLDSLPAHAADVAHNLRKVLGETVLSEAERWGCALTAALTVRESVLASAISRDALAASVAEAALVDARTAAVLMAMNNAQYRSLHVLGDDYRERPAALRMKGVARPASPAAFELFAVSASALNGCEVCLRHHEAKGRSLGLTADQMHAAIRIASVVRGVSVALASAHTV